MIRKLAFKNLLRNPIMNFLMILQMIVIFFIAISMTSSVMSRFSYYIPLKSILKSDSEYYNLFYAVDPETGIAGTTTDRFKQHLIGNPEVSASYTVWLNYEDMQQNDTISALSFDDLWLETYIPELSAGAWFSLENWNKERIPVIVSENSYGFQVGDNITFTAQGTEEKISCEIIGILAEGSRIVGYEIPQNGKISCKNLYSNYYHSIEEQTLFIFPQSMLNTDVVNTQLHGPLLVTYSSNSTDDQREANRTYIKKMQTLCSISTKDLYVNSITYIFEQCKMLLPILISVLILTLVSTMSVNALSAKRQIHTYTVYYICGLPWMKCVYINLLTSLYLVIISLILTLTSIKILSQTPLLNTSVVEIGGMQMLICVSITVLYVVFSAVLPLQIMHSNTPNQILKEN